MHTEEITKAFSALAEAEGGELTIIDNSGQVRILRITNEISLQ
jgi:hypothetical protein